MRLDASLDRGAVAWGIAAVTVALALVAIGSGGLRWFDAALVGYLFGTLFAIFGTVYRYRVWLRRPPTARLNRRGWDAFRAGGARNLVRLAGLAGTNLAAQTFIRRRSRVRWVAHLLVFWGCALAAAVTFPLVFGWLHFETRPEDPATYLVVLFGLTVGQFGADSLMKIVMFNLLNVSAAMVIVGSGMALFRRLREPAAMARQQFGNDLIPLLLLLAISVTGLALTFSAHLLRGAGYPVLSLIHALIVSLTLLYLPFGKLLHIFQRPLHLAVLLRRRDEARDEPARCGVCGERFATADQMADLRAGLRESGLAFDLDLCPRCRRRRLGRVQSLAFDRARSHG